MLRELPKDDADILSRTFNIGVFKHWTLNANANVAKDEGLRLLLDACVKNFIESRGGKMATIADFATFVDQWVVTQLDPDIREKVRTEILVSFADYTGNHLVVPTKAYKQSSGDGAKQMVLDMQGRMEDMIFALFK